LNIKTFSLEVRRYRGTFAIVAGAVLLAGFTWVLLLPVRYVATTQLMVSISGSSTAAAYENDQVVAGRVNSYIALLTTDVVNQRVVDALRLPITASELARDVSATNVPPKTSLIDISVTADSPQSARLLADTVASQFVEYTRALETPTGEDSQKVRTTVVSTAGDPQAHHATRIVLGVLVVLAAALLGSVAVWIRAWREPAVPVEQHEAPQPLGSQS